jgi:hypothetical protein
MIGRPGWLRRRQGAACYQFANLIRSELSACFRPSSAAAAPRWCLDNFICAQLPEVGLESERFAIRCPGSKPRIGPQDLSHEQTFNDRPQSRQDAVVGFGSAPKYRSDR